MKLSYTSYWLPYSISGTVLRLISQYLVLSSTAAQNGAVDAGNYAANGAAVFVKLSNRVGEGQALQNHRCCLGARNVVPVEHGPIFLFGHFPPIGDAENHPRHVGIVGQKIGHDFQIENASGAQRDMAEANGRPPSA